MAAQPDVSPPHAMNLLPEPRWLDAGDAAFTVEFGDDIAPELLGAVKALDGAIAQAQGRGALPGLIETMPTFRSLTVFYDPLQTGRETLEAQVRQLLDGLQAGDGIAGRAWRLPICYDGDCGPDLAETAQAAGMGVDALIALHSRTPLQVYMLGFLPGFPFMGDLPAALRRPRRTQPRVRVPAGSVSIAGSLCAIYPWESPGGWHLLGRCPVPLFDARQDSPSLLAPGDQVHFQPVDWAEYQRLHQAARAGDLGRDHWLKAAAPPGVQA